MDENDSKSEFYNLKWIIVRQVRRKNDIRYSYLWSSRCIPRSFFEEYEKEDYKKIPIDHPLACYWSKLDEKLFACKQLVEPFYSHTM